MRALELEGQWYTLNDNGEWFGPDHILTARLQGITTSARQYIGPGDGEPLGALLHIVALEVEATDVVDTTELPATEEVEGTKY